MATVLIVDDEAAVSDLLRDLLADLGFNVVTATNGRRALESLASLPDPPALVLSDIMMPQLNGIELARAVKTTPGLQHVPVILMSAVPHTVADGVADAFVGKPFDIDALIALVQAYLA